MAIQTSLRPIARRIAESVKAFATSQGVPEEGYALVGAWDRRTDHIRLLLGTDHQIDKRRWYIGIQQALRQAFVDYPWIPKNIGLVIERVAKLESVYFQFLLAEDEEDLTDLLERS
jgi:hypothetical protein